MDKVFHEIVSAYLANAQMPGRIDTLRTGGVLGYPEHAIPVLVAEKMLKPLGNPAPNAPKWFSSRQIVEHAMDPEWLDKANRKLSAYWITRSNGKRVSKTPRGSTERTVGNVRVGSEVAQ